MIYSFRFELLNPHQFVTTNDTQIVSIWNLTNFTTPQHTFVVNDLIQKIFILPHNRFIVYRSSEDINIWDLEGRVTTLLGHTKEITYLAYKGGKLISGAYNGELKIWDLQTEQLQASLIGHTRSINTIVITNDLWYTGSSDETIRIWDDIVCIKVIHTPVKKIIAFRNTKIISTDLTKNISVWSIQGVKELQIHIKHDDIKLLPNDQLLIILSNGFKIWDLDTDKCVTTWTYEKIVKHFTASLLPEGSEGKIVLTINNDILIF